MGLIIDVFRGVQELELYYTLNPTTFTNEPIYIPIYSQLSNCEILTPSYSSCSALPGCLYCVETNGIRILLNEILPPIEQESFDDQYNIRGFCIDGWDSSDCGSSSSSDSNSLQLHSFFHIIVLYLTYFIIIISLIFNH